MEQQQQQARLEVTAEDLYAVIGQLTIENRALRARLRALEAGLEAARAEAEATNGTARFRDLEPAGTP